MRSRGADLLSLLGQLLGHVSLAAAQQVRGDQVPQHHSALVGCRYLYRTPGSDSGLRHGLSLLESFVMQVGGATAHLLAVDTCMGDCADRWPVNNQGLLSQSWLAG